MKTIKQLMYEKYPDEPCLYQIKDNITFSDVIDALNNGFPLDEILLSGESMDTAVREMIFNELSSITGKPVGYYSNLYFKSVEPIEINLPRLEINKA